MGVEALLEAGRNSAFDMFALVPGVDVEPTSLLPAHAHEAPVNNDCLPCSNGGSGSCFLPLPGRPPTPALLLALLAVLPS
jgi:hypothetical protein